jgi:hypothetical protein
VSEPKDAPVGRLKCCPRVGLRGDVSVNPRRLSVVAMSIVPMVSFADFVMGGEEWEAVPVEWEAEGEDSLLLVCW